MPYPMQSPVPLQHLIQQVSNAFTGHDLLKATQALAASGEAEAAPMLVEVLGFNNPGAAVAAVDGLIAIGEASVAHLLKLDPQNYGARAWAVRALAGIGDIRGLNLLIDALGSDVAASVRRAAAKGLGSLVLDGLEADSRPTIQERCLTALLDALADGEWVVRYAVTVGLESLAQGLEPHGPDWRRLQQALVALSEAADCNPPVVCLRARVALTRLSPSPWAA